MYSLLFIPIFSPLPCYSGTNYIFLLDMCGTIPVPTSLFPTPSSPLLSHNHILLAHSTLHPTHCTPHPPPNKYSSFCLHPFNHYSFSHFYCCNQPTLTVPLSHTASLAPIQGSAEWQPIGTNLTYYSCGFWSL